MAQAAVNTAGQVSQIQQIIAQKLHVQTEKFIAKSGIRFNIMILGAPAMGKCTFMNSLFGCQLFDIGSKTYDLVESIKAETTTHCIQHCEDADAEYELSITRLLGSQSLVDNKKSVSLPRKIIESQMSKFLDGEFDYSDAAQSANETVKDERIHLLVYFVAPGAYGLTHTDIATLKTLDNVNKLIVIAKADSMTPKELDSLRAKVAKQMKAEQISSSIVISDKEGDKPLAIFAGFDPKQKDCDVNLRQYKWGDAKSSYEDVNNMKYLVETFFNQAMSYIESTHSTYYARFKSQTMFEKFGKDPAKHQDESVLSLMRRVKRASSKPATFDCQKAMEDMKQKNDNFIENMTEKLQEKQNALEAQYKELLKAQEESSAISRDSKISKSKKDKKKDKK